MAVFALLMLVAVIIVGIKLLAPVLLVFGVFFAVVSFVHWRSLRADARAVVAARAAALVPQLADVDPEYERHLRMRFPLLYLPDRNVK